MSWPAGTGANGWPPSHGGYAPPTSYVSSGAPMQPNNQAYAAPMSGYGANTMPMGVQTGAQFSPQTSMASAYAPSALPNANASYSHAQGYAPAPTYQQNYGMQPPMPQTQGMPSGLSHHNSGSLAPSNSYQPTHLSTSGSPSAPLAPQYGAMNAYPQQGVANNAHLAPSTSSAPSTQYSAPYPQSSQYPNSHASYSPAPMANSMSMPTQPQTTQLFQNAAPAQQPYGQGQYYNQQPQQQPTGQYYAPQNQLQQPMQGQYMPQTVSPQPPQQFASQPQQFAPQPQQYHNQPQYPTNQYQPQQPQHNYGQNPNFSQGQNSSASYAPQMPSTHPTHPPPATPGHVAPSMVKTAPPPSNAVHTPNLNPSIILSAPPASTTPSTPDASPVALNKSLPVSAPKKTPFGPQQTNAHPENSPHPPLPGAKKALPPTPKGLASHPPSTMPPPTPGGAKTATSSPPTDRARSASASFPTAHLAPNPSATADSTATPPGSGTPTLNRSPLPSNRSSPSASPKLSAPTRAETSPGILHTAHTPALGDSKYHIYTSMGVNMSDLPSNLWKSKYQTLHTIVVSGAPKLTQMNSRLGNLPHLTSLSLRSCQISTICDPLELVGGTLSKLDLGENRIEIVPEFVGSKLTALQTLSLDHNRIMVLPKSLSMLAQLMNLDASGNHLSTLDAGLGQCSNLVSLSLASNNFVDIPAFVDRLKSLQTFDMSSNRVSLPVRTTVWQLPKLTQFIMSSNTLGDIPAEVCLAQKLTSLHWENNRCKKIHDALFTLTKLVHLRLARNELSELSERISRLTNLQDLDISSNNFDILPHQLFSLRSLSEANTIIDDNPFRSIPTEIRESSSATSSSTSASGSGNSSSHAAQAHRGTQGRTGSSSSSAANTALNPAVASRSHAIYRFLAQLSEKAAWRRMKLMLVGNGNIGKTSLKRALSAPTGQNSDSSSPIASSAPVRAASKIKDTFKKAATTAGTFASNLGTSIGASFSSNPSSPGPGVFDPTADTIATDGIDIDDWIVDLDDYPDCIPLKRSNSTSSGAPPTPEHASPASPAPATTASSASDESSTGNYAVFSCYDFAGQDVYYPTHSLFVTSRSIYLVLFSLKDLEGSRVEYWLQMVQAKAGYSSPVIIVATHDDEKTLTRTFITETLAAMKKKYSRFAFVKGVVSVSSKIGTGIKELRKLIVSLALAHQTMKEQVPRSYILLEGEIKKRRRQSDLIDDSSPNSLSGTLSAANIHSNPPSTSSPNSMATASLDSILASASQRSHTDKQGFHDHHTVTLDEWYQMCERCFIKTKEDATDALNFLADVGVVFHFKSDNASDSMASMVGPAGSSSKSTSGTSPTALENIVILNPQWIADLLSTVISLKHNYIRDGILDESVLPQLWKTYPAHLHGSLLQLLKRFEIALPMAQAGKYIVPSMLPKDNASLVGNLQSRGSSPSPAIQGASDSLPSLQNLWKPVEDWYGPMARIVSIKFCPMGFFGRFVARAMHLPGVRTISYSQNSFVAEMERTGERAVVLYNEYTYEVLVWSAAPNSPLSASQRKIMFLICDTLDILHESLYSSNRRTVWVVCPHCMALGCNGFQPTLFTTENCLIAFTYGLPTLPCTAASRAAHSPHSVPGHRRPSVLQKVHSALFSRDHHPGQPTSGTGSPHGSQPLLNVPSVNDRSPSPNQRSARTPSVSNANFAADDDDFYVYSSTSDVYAKLFADFLTRKDKHHAKSIALFEVGGADEDSGEQSDNASSHHPDSTTDSILTASNNPTSPSAKIEVPMERIAPDISFHSLGDLLIPFSDILLGKMVARGGFAEIFKAEFRGETVAVKKFLSGGGDFSDSASSGDGGSTSSSSALTSSSAAAAAASSGGISEEFSESFRELQHEAFLMAQLKHPNVVCLKALCVRPICMVMEWVPHGTLSALLWERDTAQCLPWATRLKYALDVANGLAYLHSLNIMHLDFRSPNLLVFDPAPHASTCIKVADFGLSTSSSGSHKGIKAFNPFWSSPEIISRGTYDLSTDVYSLGIVLWELLQHGRPFEEHRDKYPGPEIILTGAIANEDLRPTFPPNTPEELQNLITQCWQHDAAQRPSASDVVRQLETIQMQFQRNPSAWAEPSFNLPPETPRD